MSTRGGRWLAVDKSKYGRGVDERTVRRLSLAEKLRLVNLARHYGPSEAARQMEVDRQTVYLWLGRYEQGGSDALSSLPRGKQEPRTVTPEVKARLLGLKRENPRRSSPKIARLYEDESGLKVHRTTVWAVLKKGEHQSSLGGECLSSSSEPSPMRSGRRT